MKADNGFNIQNKLQDSHLYFKLNFCKRLLQVLEKKEKSGSLILYVLVILFGKYLIVLKLGQLLSSVKKALHYCIEKPRL